MTDLKKATDKAPKDLTKVLTKHEFWMKHAPDFNFELDEDELIAEAIKQEFARKILDVEDQYVVIYDA